MSGGGKPIVRKAPLKGARELADEKVPSGYITGVLIAGEKLFPKT